MPRHPGPYQLVLRRDTGGKPTYYIRFRDDSGELLPWTSSGMTSKTAAREWAGKRLKAGHVTTRQSLTFARFAESWWKWDECNYIRGKLKRGERLSRSYADNQRGNLDRHILPAFGKKLLAKITTGMIESWVMDLGDKRGLSAVTVNHNLATLKVMFAEAFRLGTIPADPAAKVAPLQEGRKQRTVLTIAEIRALFDEARMTAVWGGDERAYTASLIGVSCGLRMGEIQALTVASIGEGFLTVSHAWERAYGLKEPKYGARRRVPVSERAGRHLRQITDMSPYQENDDLIFYGKDRTRPVDHKYLGSTLTAALTAIGIPEDERRERGLTFHATRHTFNSIMRGKVPDHVLQAMTGHRTAAMVEHYSHVGTDELAGVLEVQGEVFG